MTVFGSASVAIDFFLPLWVPRGDPCVLGREVSSGSRLFCGETSMNRQLGSTARLVILYICFNYYVYFSSFLYAQDYGPPLPGTKPLTMSGDIASELVAGVDRFLLKQIEESRPGRQKFWNRDFSSMRAYQASVEPNRKTLAHILGVRDRSPERRCYGSL